MTFLHLTIASSSIPGELPPRTTPLCAGPTVGANCRGIVTADVLELGLSRGAIAARKLEGVNWDKRHERFILVQPLAVKEGLHLVGLVLLEVLMTRERDTLCPVLDELFLTLSRRRVVPLYTRVDALRPTESRPAHRQCLAR